MAGFYFKYSNMPGEENFKIKNIAGALLEGGKEGRSSLPFFENW